MATIKVDVVSAEEQIFSGQAKFVALPGEAGELGILPNHTPLITRIRPGAVRIEAENGEEEFVFVAGGILDGAGRHGDPRQGSRRGEGRAGSQARGRSAAEFGFEPRIRDRSSGTRVCDGSARRNSAFAQAARPALRRVVSLS